VGSGGVEESEGSDGTDWHAFLVMARQRKPEQTHEPIDAYVIVCVRQMSDGSVAWRGCSLFFPPPPPPLPPPLTPDMKTNTPHSRRCHVMFLSCGWACLQKLL
jgi:hypothetical protein